jgi:hypothetical protein
MYSIVYCGNLQFMQLRSFKTLIKGKMYILKPQFFFLCKQGDMLRVKSSAEIRPPANSRCASPNFARPLFLLRIFYLEENKR